MASEQAESYEGWAILELFGHRRLAGLVSEQEIAGAAFLRIDVPGPDSAVTVTQFYSAPAIYSLTPTSEEIARAFAIGRQPQPVQRWELAAPTTRPADGGGYPVDPGVDEQY